VNPAAFILAILPVFSTTLGGLAAMRFSHRIHPVMALTAGMLVTTALVNLLPEARELVGDEAGLLFLAAPVGGYLLFTALEALVHRETYEHQHPPGEDPHEPHEHERRPHDLSMVAIAGPAGLIVHSAMDGLAIGLGFGVSAEIGLVVAIAVLAHDFADGVNIVTLALAGGQDRRFAITVMLLDAIAAPIGFLLSLLITPDPALLGTLLGVFAGVFIAIGAGHLLPEAQHRRPESAAPLVAIAALGAAIILAIRPFLEH